MDKELKLMNDMVAHFEKEKYRIIDGRELIHKNIVLDYLRSKRYNLKIKVLKKKQQKQT